MDCENDALGVGDVLLDHLPDLLLDVLRLVADGNTGDAREIDEG